MSRVSIKVGCDPELFLIDPSTKQFMSAHTVVKGTKVEPFKVPSGAVQVDGTAAEFNIDPAEDEEHFVYNIRKVMSALKEQAGQFQFVLDPTVTFEPSYFHTLPESVRELGCNPDWNAWTGNVNPAPDGASTTMRTASGHVHVGWCEDVNPQDPIHVQDCHAVIKQLDYFLGLPSLLWDPDDKRRNLYGKAGAHRKKPYGAEYRVLSNVWLRSERIQRWVFNAATSAIHNLLSGKPSMEQQFGNFAQVAIDGNHVDWQNKALDCVVDGKPVKVHGERVWGALGMSRPNVDECLKYSWDRQSESSAQSVAKTKKLNPKHFYISNPPIIGESPGIQALNSLWAAVNTGTNG